MIDFYSMHFLSACLFSFLLFILTKSYYFYKFKICATKISNTKNLRNDSMKLETEESTDWEQGQEKDNKYVLEGNKEDIKEVRMMIKNLMEDNRQIKAMIERLIIEGSETKVMLGKIVAEKKQNSDQLQNDSTKNEKGTLPENEKNRFNLVTVKNKELVEENNKSLLSTILKLPGDDLNDSSKGVAKEKSSQSRKTITTNEHSYLNTNNPDENKYRTEVFVEELTSEEESQICSDKNKCSVTGSRSNSTYRYFEMDADLSNPIIETKEVTHKFNSISDLISLETDSYKASITDTVDHEISTPVDESGNNKEVLVKSEFENSLCNPTTTSISVKPMENSRKDIFSSNVLDSNVNSNKENIFQKSITTAIDSNKTDSEHSELIETIDVNKFNFNVIDVPHHNNAKTKSCLTDKRFRVLGYQRPIAFHNVSCAETSKPDSVTSTGKFNFNAELQPVFNFTGGNTPCFSAQPNYKSAWGPVHGRLRHQKL